MHLINWWHNHFFAFPWLLPLLLIVPFMVYYYWKEHNNSTASISVSSTRYYQPTTHWKVQFRHLPFVFRCLAIASIVIALSRPQKRFTEEQTSGNGIDIMLCFDISGSMTANDFKPTRLEAAKEIATKFVNDRVGDRVGVVIFSSHSFTLCPLTTDHPTVLSQINSIHNGYLEEDGTAIGSGLTTSVDRLKDSDAKSKIVILLTDGVDFGGTIPPDIAENIAKTYHVKVYCIGIGTNQDLNPIARDTTTQKTKFGFNDNLLKHISSQTGGQYFQAMDNDGLQKSYNTINALEKSKIEISTHQHFTEAFQPFVWFALASLIIELVLKLSIFRKFP